MHMDALKHTISGTQPDPFCAKQAWAEDILTALHAGRNATQVRGEGGTSRALEGLGCGEHPHDQEEHQDGVGVEVCHRSEHGTTVNNGNV